MHISPFFLNLRSAYMAELEDMSCDSEGTFILNHRLAQRRGEIDFLVHMLEISPEMVAVVLHKAFRFTSARAMDHLITQEPEALPLWEDLEDTVEIAPWADALVQTLLKQPAGSWFMSVSAALEYMAGLPDASHAGRTEDDSDDGTGDQQGDYQHLSADDADDTGERTREEAAADWMVEQGFDRKD